MSQARVPQHGAALLGLAGGMLVVAGGLTGGYFVVANHSEARAATLSPTKTPEAPKVASSTQLPQQQVEVKTGTGTTLKMTWADLGIAIDQDEVGRTQFPIKLDRDKAVVALIKLKAKADKSPVDAYLDLEERTIHDDAPGVGIDPWGSLPRILAAARNGASQVELAAVPVPATTTKASLGIDDISQVLGHYVTKFSVSDRDRNFNLKLAASKINGTVLQPKVEWSFNGQVGERSDKEGYKIAHVITAGEMVAGLAGGTCQISTTLFGASFFAGLDIVKTLNHSRPSAYTPLGFDATVVWPDTDLVLKNPYDFPVAIHYRVANGEALVEILGKKRPFDKIVFARKLIEETPYGTEERLDDEMPEGQTMLDQAGFNGYKLTRFRRFYKGKEMVREQKWTVSYKPVTEYVRRGTNKDPNAQMPKEKEIHALKVPNESEYTDEKIVLTQ
jgi:vancomycin resistance protein YoaR